MNGTVKDGAHAALGDATRRRVRGVAGQSILAAMAFMANNIKQIRAFLANAKRDEAGVLRLPRTRTADPDSLEHTEPVATTSGAPPP
jgi:hypothetical protein